MTLVIRKSSCSVPLRQEGAVVVVARCGWPTYQEGTVAHCTRPDCIGYTPRARELQALAVQLDLTAAIEKLNTLLSVSLSKLGE